MATEGAPPVGRPLLVLAGFILAGIPLVGYIWESLSQLLSGQVNGGRLAITAGLLLVLFALFRVAGRTLFRLTSAPPGEGSAEEPVVAGTMVLTAGIAMIIFGIWAIAYGWLLNR